MSVELTIDPTLSIPAHEQLTNQITGAILSGKLSPGSQLPTVRALARDLGIAPGTVMRTYTSLSDAGYITTARSKGTVVNGRKSNDDELAHHLTRLTQRYLVELHAFGFTENDAIAELARLSGTEA
ncbi:GntR family transcriptional regulator [Arcanobacterium phocae]|uniref:Transcriptional regulator, GntR family n=1 Tax=Arcanobacterium phocae TaxID=131112 RepID=A0A1H2LGN4_9ACTO|nr:GntR family transcriptional regulator [Arcanobacterium phocae]SDU80069.1 transcriptional regulator, GntR family [Arcanobacterium phocae]